MDHRIFLVATSRSSSLDHPLSIPPLDVKQLLHKFDLHPDKRLGQNFLIDPVALRQVVSSASISPQDTILEVGPGLGSLTRYLAILGKRIVVVELDLRLIPPLKEVLEPYTNVTIINDDILRLDPSELISGSRYLVVANIPYYITSALIRHLLESKIHPSRMVLTVQSEVAQRICSQPGDMSLLSLSVQVFGQPRITAHIPASAFYPSPKVDSAVVRVDIYPHSIIPKTALPIFFNLTRAGFGQKRKTLRNALSAGLGWKTIETEALLMESGIDPKCRAQTLSLEEWSRIVEVYKSMKQD